VIGIYGVIAKALPKKETREDGSVVAQKFRVKLLPEDLRNLLMCFVRYNNDKTDEIMHHRQNLFEDWEVLIILS
jgi:hypothetical protein